MSDSVDFYREPFNALLEEEGHSRLEDCMTTEIFDEIPLFSRESQIDFLAGLNLAEINKLTIRATVLHQLKINEFARRRFSDRFDPYFRMISVTGWWDVDSLGTHEGDGESTLLIPNFWIGNMESPEMAQFSMDVAISRGSDFVRAATDGIDGVRLFDGWSTGPEIRFLRRVYIEIAVQIP